MTPEIQRSAKRLESWVREAALPFWAEVQEDTGAWPEHLHPDGTPDREAVRRHRVQARQVYTYALAHRLGWWSDAGVVERTVDFMWKAGWAPDGRPGLIHRLGADGSVASDLRDLYDHAFYLLALGWAQSVCGEQEDRLAKTLAFLDSLAHPAGGYAEGLPPALPRRQNPHMHVLEACLNLHTLGLAGDWVARAERLMALWDAHMFDDRRQSVREFFDENWHWDGGTFEPGHAMEWVWLLGLWGDVSGENRATQRDALYGRALVDGGVWLRDEVDHAGESVRDTSRLWVQTELVKAHLTQARHGVPGAAGMAASAVDGLLEEWLEPRGTWRDQLGACGQTVSTTIPTSTFYHIITMAAEMSRAAS